MDLRVLQAGSILQNGKYRIQSVLGQGGFGITYLAEQTGLGMKVAIKEFFLKGSCQRNSGTSRISVPVTENEELVQRCLKKFKSEARKIASLNNDHIINIIDVFDENGTSYYVMKFLAGGSLAALQKTGAISEKVALRVIGEIADALKSVHSRGLLHLDIKPANILFDERGRAVLIDFGVSKYVDSQQDSSTTSSLIGFSRGFAPLEQVNSTLSALSPASDIYALGATLYSLVTGKMPPEASVVMDSGLPEFPADVSAGVREAITKAMEPKRKDRPQDVDAFLALLPDEASEQLTDDTIIVTAVPPEPEPVRKSSRLPLILSSAMLAAAIFLAVSTFASRRNSSDYSGYAAGSGQVEELNDQVSSLTRQNADLKQQVDDLKRQASSSGSSSALQSQINDLQSQVNSLTQKNSSLQKENSSLKKQVNDYKPDAERWRRQMDLNK